MCYDSGPGIGDGGAGSTSSSSFKSGKTRSTKLGFHVGGCSGANKGCVGGGFGVLRGKTDSSKTTSVLMTVESDNEFYSLYPLVKLS